MGRDCPTTIITGTPYFQNQWITEIDVLQPDGLLNKPFSPARLLDSISLAMDLTEQQAADEPLYSAALPTPGKNPCVLVVEDNPINQQITQALLEDVGFCVTLANHGREALGLLEQQGFDGILMDMQMPILDGYETAKIIRDDTRLNKLPIIAMTANASQEDRKRCLDSGMNDYLEKPLNVSMLYQVLGHWISSGTPQEPAEPQPDTAALYEAIPAIPGLDRQAAFDHVNGNIELYRKLLLKFAHQHHNIPTLLQQALQQDSLQQGVYWAHTLKGVAGNLGAKEIAASSMEIEFLLRNDSLPSKTQLDTLHQQMDSLCNAILQLESCEQADPDIVEQPLADDDVDAILQSLQAYLKNNDIESLEVLGHLESRAQFDVSELKHLVENYDFESALISLKKVRETINN